MAQPRELGYDAYNVLPDSERPADLLGDEMGGEGEVGYGAGELTDIPQELITTGKVTLGEDGVELEADTSLDTYTPNLDEHEVTHDLIFSVTDLNTVAWASGTIYVGDDAGTSYAIDAGNTGNMAARTYIYLDIAVSTTVLQTTTSVSATVGPNKKLIAVAQNGTVEATYTVYGGIGGLKLPNSSVPFENNNWNFSGVWSVTDSNTIAWGAGTLTLSNGDTYAISAGNTGNMAAKTYVYFDLAASTTALQKTTTAANAVGAGKILIAVCEDNTTEAEYQVMNDYQTNIDGARIVAGSIVAANIAAGTITAAKIAAGTITANEIATGTITAANMNVSQLSAIAADMGSITAGTVTIDSSGYIRGGATGYLTGTGFWMGYSGGAYKFHIGNPSGSYASWDGTSLVLSDMSLRYRGTFGESISVGDAVCVADGSSSHALYSTGATNSLFQGGWLAQTILTSANAKYIQGISIKNKFPGSSGAYEITVSIRATSSGAPTGSDLESRTATVSGTTATSEPWHRIMFDGEGIAVSPNTTYAIIIRSTGANALDTGYEGGNQYSDGSMYTSADGGSTWSISTDNDVDISWYEGQKTPGLWYKADTNGVYSGPKDVSCRYAGDPNCRTGWGTEGDLTDNFIGLASGAASATALGIATVSGLTAGVPYYLSDTPGALSTSPGTVVRQVGRALSTTQILIDCNFEYA